MSSHINIITLNSVCENYLLHMHKFTHLAYLEDFVISSKAMIFAVMNAIFTISSTGLEPVTSRFRCDALTN